MKKTLAALIIGAFAASAANAAVVYNNEGTKVEVDGSLRFVLEKTNKGGQEESKGAKHTHSGLRNDGSRFGFRVKHELGDGYYALGRLEVRLDGKSENTDGFGNLYTKRAYVGLGHKERGEVAFGRQVTIADDASIADDYSYGLIDKGSYVPTAGNAVVRYDYKGIDRLQLGLSYQFANSRSSNNEVTGSKAAVQAAAAKTITVVDKLGNDQTITTKPAVSAADAKYEIKNGFQIGAIYNKSLEQGFVGKFVYGRTTYSPVTGTNTKHHKDGFLASAGYNFSEKGELVASLDAGYAKDKQGNESDKLFFVSPGFRANVTDLSRVYGNYKYEQTKDNEGAKDKTHGVLLGVDYQLHKQVITYVEGKYQVTKSYDKDNNYTNGSKVKDKAIGAGLRVYW